MSNVTNGLVVETVSILHHIPGTPEREKGNLSKKDFGFGTPVYKKTPSPPSQKGCVFVSTSPECRVLSQVPAEKIAWEGEYPCSEPPRY